MHDFNLLTMPVAIRPATPIDAPTITAIQRAAWEADYEGNTLTWLLGIPAEVLTAKWSQAAVSHPSHALLLATANDACIGFVAISPVEVATLEIHPDHRRQGHGSRLLNAAVDHIRANGAHRASAWVTQGHKQRAAFLTSAGFATDGRRQRLQHGEIELVVDHFTAQL